MSENESILVTDQLKLGLGLDSEYVVQQYYNYSGRTDWTKWDGQLGGETDGQTE